MRQRWRSTWLSEWATGQVKEIVLWRVSWKLAVPIVVGNPLAKRTAKHRLPDLLHFF